MRVFPGRSTDSISMGRRSLSIIQLQDPDLRASWAQSSESIISVVITHHRPPAPTHPHPASGDHTLDLRPRSDFPSASLRNPHHFISSNQSRPSNSHPHRRTSHTAWILFLNRVDWYNSRRPPRARHCWSHRSIPGLARSLLHFVRPPLRCFGLRFRFFAGVPTAPGQQSLKVRDIF